MRPNGGKGGGGKRPTGETEKRTDQDGEGWKGARERGNERETNKKKIKEK